MSHKDKVIEALREIATRAGFLTLADICEALNVQEGDCMDVLDECVAEGLLRKASAKDGQPYFWISTNSAS
ncbi:MAG: MarR family transcriptional regulator [bacterium]|nr:MarR family transcriptional regulator [bacterium]